MNESGSANTLKKEIRIKAIKYVSAGVALAAISMLGIAQDQPPMSFFVISVGDGLFYCVAVDTTPYPARIRSNC